jgi:hypothetical protein
VSLKPVGSVTVALPASPANSTTACDNAVATGYPYKQPQDEISICTTGAVKISGLTVQAAWPANTCSDSQYGIVVDGGATLSASKVDVAAAGDAPLYGCQGGVGIEVGDSVASPAQAGTAKLTDVTVSGYDKNGITVDGAGSSATITKSTVTGAGPQTVIPQNGIQISDGAKGVISKSTISGNECNNAACGSDNLNQTQSAGVMFYGAASGSELTTSTVTGNDMGVYYVSTAPAEPASPEVTVSKDNFTANRYEQIVLDAGFASLVTNTISGTSNVGIQVLQYDGQAYAPASKASHQTISGQGVGVQVLSDQSPTGDLPGAFDISHSTFLTGNTVATSDNSSNYTIGGVGNN